jgi:hypothetical protein
MLHQWLQAADQTGNLVRIVLFDFRKAFDPLDHNQLILKMKSLNLSPQIANWIIDFLINRKQRVELNNGCFSDWSDVRSGVPQGTKLGPWLYILMINDLTDTNNIILRMSVEIYGRHNLASYPGIS